MFVINKFAILIAIEFSILLLKDIDCGLDKAKNI